MLHDKEDNSLFWTTNKSNTNEINRGNEVGSSSQTIYTTSNRIISVALDVTLNRFYWIERIGNIGTIYSIKYDGTDLKEIVTTNKGPRSLAVMSVFDLDNDGYDSLSDCDDSDPNINPGEDEIPYNGIDDDCNAETLDDDLDQDGYAFLVDCNDMDSSINPGEYEIPCNAMTFDDDLDQDGYLKNVGCNDEDPDIHPDAVEIPNNSIDEDCDGADLVTSTQELDNTMINIYPSPASELINIDVAGQLNYQATLYNLDGKIIYSSSNPKQIILGFTSAGMYLLEIINISSGQKIVKKIVLEKF